MVENLAWALIGLLVSSFSFATLLALHTSDTDDE